MNLNCRCFSEIPATPRQHDFLKLAVVSGRHVAYLFVKEAPEEFVWTERWRPEALSPRFGLAMRAVSLL